jgi:chromate reductase, NAD(P)H dehydrogenase (quinone)
MIAIIVGTNRPGAITKQVAAYYAAQLQKHNISYQIVDLELLPANFTVAALYANAGKNAAFSALRDQVELADSCVFIIPEYNGSFPGVLKAFIDGFSFPSPMVHKTVALVGISNGSQGGALALSHFTDILNYLGVNVLAQKIRIPDMKNNFQKGEITNTMLNTLLNDQIKLLLK